MFTGGSSLRRGSAHRRYVCALGIAALWLGVATTARADDTVCPGAVDTCPYGRVIVVGEGGHGVFRLAQALAVSPDGRRVYVGDVEGYRIQAFTSDGRFITQWGRYGTGPGEIRAVGGLATDAAGRVFVLDSNKDRVQGFDPNGLLLASWGSSGIAPGPLYPGSNGGMGVAGAAALLPHPGKHPG